MFNSDSNPVHRCRVMWSLVMAKCVDDEWSLERLNDKDEHIRVWAIRFLSDSLSTGESSDWKPLVARLAEMATDDPSDLVLLYIASTLQKLPTDARWSVADALSARSESDFNTDRTLSIMLWLGIEPLVITDSTHAVAMLKDSTFPLIRENIARRISLEIDRELPLVEQLLAVANERADKAPAIIRGMAAALNGQKESPTPQNWSKVTEKLASNHDASMCDSLNTIGVVLRDPQTLSRLRKTVGDTSNDANSRRRALELLVSARVDELSILLRELISDRDLAATAIRGIARVDDAASADAIIAAFASLSADARIAAIDTLVSRASYALKLLQAIESNQIAASTLSAFQVRQINSLNDKNLAERVRRLWGDIRESPQDKRAEIDRLRHKFGGGDAQLGSVEGGHALFEKHCATCHVLFGEGKNLGPDLTGSNRKNLDYLLENMIDPSAVVGVDFRSAVYYLTDGRAITGVVREQNDHTLTLATPEGLQTIDREEIDEVHASEQSIMPDALLRGLTDEQIRDLLAYLMSN
jgi:putative heme-binding domain-containing protein